MPSPALPPDRHYSSGLLPGALDLFDFIPATRNVCLLTSTGNRHRERFEKSV